APGRSTGAGRRDHGHGRRPRTWPRARPPAHGRGPTGPREHAPAPPERPSPPFGAPTVAATARARPPADAHHVGAVLPRSPGDRGPGVGSAVRDARPRPAARPRGPPLVGRDRLARLAAAERRQRR